MKGIAFLFIFFILKTSSSQQSFNFAAVDHYVSTVPAAMPDSLAKNLTKPYQTEPEKVRAIFKWVTTNINYNTNKYRNRNFSQNLWKEDEDTARELKPLSERVAIMVLQRKTAVCDGYARLFKTLCDYAGIESEIIRGYARSSWGRSGQFISNHIWNTVRINGSWHLFDATWASGYVTFFSNEFISSYDDSYFMASPTVFIKDHYPEDENWTLLPKTTAVKEFQTSPFKYAAIHQFKISSYQPTKGIIEASVGDTIYFSVQGNETEKLFRISNNPYVDSSLFNYDDSRYYPKPAGLINTKLAQQNFVVENNYAEWLYVILNEEIIMRYRLVIKNSSHALAEGF